MYISAGQCSFQQFKQFKYFVMSGLYYLLYCVCSTAPQVNKSQCLRFVCCLLQKKMKKITNKNYFLIYPEKVFGST